MAIYGIVAINIHNREGYAEYERLAAEAAVGSGIEILSVDDEPKAIEGSLPGKRMVLLKFEREEDFERWYHGAAYQESAKHRYANGETVFFVTMKSFD